MRVVTRPVVDVIVKRNRAVPPIALPNPPSTGWYCQVRASKLSSPVALRASSETCDLLGSEGLLDLPMPRELDPIGSVDAEIGSLYRLVLAQIGGCVADGDFSTLQHIAAVSDLKRHLRVLLNQQDCDACIGDALHGIKYTIDQYRRRIPTGAVNRAIREAQAAHPAPGGARVLYATQGASDPPTFTLFVNRRLPATYLRYLQRRISETFDLGAAPVKFHVRFR